MSACSTALAAAEICAFVAAAAKCRVTAARIARWGMSKPVFTANDFHHDVNGIHPLAERWCADIANARLAPLMEAIEQLEKHPGSRAEDDVVAEYRKLTQ